MKRAISRLIKKVLVSCKLDKPVADLYHKTGLSFFSRLTPDRTYFRHSDIKRVSRQGVVFELHPADFSQWQIFAGTNFDHVLAALKVLSENSKGLNLDIG